jgi:carnosine N-methyltransferase
MFETDKLPNG